MHRRFKLAGATSVLVGLALAVLLPVAPPPQAGEHAKAFSTVRATASTTIPSYPNSTKGLENLMKDMMKLVEKGDSMTLASYTRSLLIPDPQTWYKATFGEETGLLLANASEPARNSVEVERTNHNFFCLGQENDGNPCRKI